MNKIIRILNPDEEGDFKIGQTKSGEMYVFHVPCNTTMNFVKLVKNKKRELKNLYVCSKCGEEYEVFRHLKPMKIRF